LKTSRTGGDRTFRPTEKDRETVKLLASLGIPQEHICLKIRNPQTKKPISKPTLQRMFKEELIGGVTEANSMVGGWLYKHATGQMGDTPHAVTAAIFWMKTRGKWSERQHAPTTEKNIEITAERVVAELAKLGFANVDDYLKAPDKRAALVDLGKHLGLFREASLEGTDEHDVKISGGLPDGEGE